MFLKGAAMCIIGIAAGGMVAAGTFAFIVMIGVFTRLAYRTHTSSYIAVYETAIVIGGTIGNIMHIYNVKMPLSILQTVNGRLTIYRHNLCLRH